jgi:hypothetical protein
LQVGDTGPVESARRSNSRVLGSPFSGLSGHKERLCVINLNARLFSFKKERPSKNQYFSFSN